MSFETTVATTMTTLRKRGPGDGDGGSGGGGGRVLERTGSIGMGATSLFTRTASAMTAFLAAAEETRDQTIILAVLKLDRRPDRDLLVELVAKFASSSPRFRCSLVSHAADSKKGRKPRFVWEELPAFRVEDVITDVTLESRDDLQAYTETRLNGITYMEGQLQWGVDVVKYCDGDTTCDLVFTCNHIVADGVTLVSLLEALSTRGGGGGVERKPATAEPRARMSVKASFLGWVWDFVVRALYFLWAALRVFLIAHLMPADAESPLKPRNVALQLTSGVRLSSLKVSVEDVKRAGKKRGFSINDVVLGCLAEGMKRYMKAEGGPLPKKITCLHIVDQRSTRGASVTRFKKGSSFGNGWIYIVLPLDLTPTTVEGNVASAHGFMQYIKSSPEPAFSLWLGNTLMSLLGAVKTLKLMKKSCYKSTLIASNVRGPAKEQDIAGSRLLEMYNCVKTHTAMSLCVSVLSYKDDLTITMTCNSSTISEPKALSNCVKQAFSDFCAE